MKILDRADMSKGILIVDDNEDVVFAYDRYLRRKGFKNIFTATTREKSFGMIRKYIDRVSIVVLDWILDDHKDCREIIAFLNKITSKSLSIIFMSTRVDVPIEYYSQYISANFDASEFFTSKDASLLHAEIKKALLRQKKKIRSRKGVLCAA